MAETKTRQPTSLPRAQEAKLRAVAEAFDDEQTAERAVRFGRKLLKRAAGLRTSAPPLAGLTKEQGERVSSLLFPKAAKKGASRK